MGKRSDFERRKNDAYDTPFSAVKPLLPFLDPGTEFCEPCAGNGHLIRHLIASGHRCIDAWDIAPGRRRGAIAMQCGDATTMKYDPSIRKFITNPPWTRALLHEIIVNLSNQATTWLLFDADWIHTSQAWPLWRRCKTIVSVGRVKWIADSEFTGKDNAAWYRFEPGHTAGPRMFGRMR